MAFPRLPYLGRQLETKAHMASRSSMIYGLGDPRPLQIFLRFTDMTGE
jgi:hypothetical protein